MTSGLARYAFSRGDRNFVGGSGPRWPLSDATPDGTNLASGPFPDFLDRSASEDHDRPLPARALSTSMNWYRIADGRLQFRGRITREPFAGWLKTTDGTATIEQAAAQLRVRFLGRARAGRRLWQQLDRLIRTDTVRKTLQEEAGHFAAAVSGLCYAPTLPRSQVALHRLVIVPRSMIAGRARNGVRARLWHSALSPLPDTVRAFLCEQILLEMDAAIRSARPSVSSPVEMRDLWSCVASDPEYVWVDPLWSGAKWTGHLIMYEMPRAPLSRAQRKDLERAVTTLQKGLETLSRVQRQNIVRAAADGLPA